MTEISYTTIDIRLWINDYVHIKVWMKSMIEFYRGLDKYFRKKTVDAVIFDTLIWIYLC